MPYVLRFASMLIDTPRDQAEALFRLEVMRDQANASDVRDAESVFHVACDLVLAFDNYTAGLYAYVCGLQRAQIRRHVTDTTCNGDDSHAE